MAMTTWVLLGLGYLLGAVTVVTVEVIGFLIMIRRLNRRIAQVEHKRNEPPKSLSPDFGLSFCNKQGVVWILEPEKIKFGSVDCEQRETKRKNDILEVFPAQKHARIRNHSLFILEPDGCHTEIRLAGCMVEAVSATSSPSRKWAKRYPIKVESKDSNLYKGNKTLYIYLETSSEKEEWCKALRLASCSDKEKLEWFSNLNSEFHRYLVSLNAEYPSFMKPTMGFNNDPKDKSVKPDGSSSKVRQFLKKLAKKASSINGTENKTNWTSVTVQQEKKANLRSTPLKGFVSESVGAVGQPFLDVTVPLLPSNSSNLGNENHPSILPDVENDERNFSNEATFACNIVLSRLFFDAKSNLQLKKLIQERIQRMLSNMRSPSFVGPVTCTGVDPGNLPPYINAIRVVPSNMDELWVFEMDIEYSGGALLNVETRLEVQELDSQEGKGTAFETSALEEVPSDLLEDFEDIGKQLNLSEVKSDELVHRDDKEFTRDGVGSHKTTTRASSQVSRWKNMLQTVAKQVSQVPLSLGIRVSSLCGTMRVFIKPPPSDQIWFGFTSMPDIHFDLEPFVGEHKITSGRLALLLITRFKVAFCETLVLPNSESIYMPWMLAEKEDWVERKVAPFLWVRQVPAAVSTAAAAATTSKQGTNSHSSLKQNLTAEGVKGTTTTTSYNKSYLGDKQHRNDSIDTAGHEVKPVTDSPDHYAMQTASLLVKSTSVDSGHVDDLNAPLLIKYGESAEQTVDSNALIKTQSLHLSSQSRSTIGQDHHLDGDDTKGKRVGTKARMLGFGKKVGEKFEEKRRNIEERGKHIVEKMKGPQRLDRTDSD